MSKVQIVLDSRENHLKENFDLGKVEYISEQLPVGDVLFRHLDGRTLLICERKTASDMYSSIISGRYAEQRERLKVTGVKICYILESYKDNKVFRANELNVVTGALENLVLYHNIPILPTFSVPHTAKVIQNIASKLNKNDISPSPLISTSSSSDVPKIGDVGAPVVAVITQRKDKMMEHMLEHQLLLIPGVSVSTAKLIADRYPSVRSLITAYDGLLTDSEKWNMLADISLGKKKLGKVLSRRIYSVYAVL